MRNGLFDPQGSFNEIKSLKDKNLESFEAVPLIISIFISILNHIVADLKTDILKTISMILISLLINNTINGKFTNFNVYLQPMSGSKNICRFTTPQKQTSFYKSELQLI